MRFVGTTTCALLAAAFGAIGSLYLSMWLGGLFSAYGPGSYLGLVLAIIAVPIGGLSAGWVAAVVVWQALARKSQPSA
jgi:hypothetical protein